MKHATYVGPDCGRNLTKGMTALIRDAETPGHVLAQFDALYAAKADEDIGFGWHEFPADQFVPSVCQADFDPNNSTG